MEEHGRSGALYRVLIDITTDKRPFEVVLQNFGSFEPRVIYVHVVENNLLRILRDQVLREMRKGMFTMGNIEPRFSTSYNHRF